MSGRQELAARLTTWLREKDWTARRLSLEAGLAENAVGRILERPDRQTQRETWVKLAAYLHWSENEVLSLAGYASPPDESEDPWQLLEAAMRGFRLRERYRAHLRQQIEFLLQAHQTEPQNGS